VVLDMAGVRRVVSLVFGAGVSRVRRRALHRAGLACKWGRESKQLLQIKGALTP
jgi:hypothetical protein